MGMNELVGAIQAKFGRGEFDKFINEINFPKFKNFSPGAKLSFNFPVTAIVGPNGGGKSSILHAAWGMPVKYSTSRFWFSTPVDPIDFNPRDQNRYWYSHYVKDLREYVQSRKMCGNKRNGYWEPTRPAQKEGMAAMPVKTSRNEVFMSSSGDRWSPVERIPHYFNAKTDTSAFDRFFNSTNISTLDARQDYFVRYSQKLKLIIDGELNSFKYYGVERIERNFLLSSTQLRHVNKILQKNYLAARFVSHKLYDKSSFSPSVIFETGARNYSECFAGSGELAVVNLVLALEEVGEYDLLLLDEPETSLHPGAQAKLLEHILSIVKDKKVQVIISTHSPTFVDLLPREALVVLDEFEGKVVPRVSPSKSSAFSTLGAIDHEKINIIVEDKLLKALTERSIGRLQKYRRQKVHVESSGLGVSEMLSNQVRAHIQSGAKVLMVVDGDQQPVEAIFQQDPATLSEERKNDVIEELKRLNISIVGGSGNLDEWMRWCRKNVIVIPQVCPEAILLELLDPSHHLLAATNASNRQFKDAVRKVLQSTGNEVTSEAHFHILKMKLGEAEAGGTVDGYLEDLKLKIDEWIDTVER